MMIREQISSARNNPLFVPLLLLGTLTIAIFAVFSPRLLIAATGVAAGGAVTLLITARWPEVFVILAIWTNFLTTAYIPGLAVGEFGATPYMLFTTLAAAGFFLQIVVGKRRLIIPAGFSFFLLFTGVSTLSLLVVQSFRLAAGAYARAALDWMLFFLLVQMLVNRRRVRQLIDALLAQAIVVVAWGIASGIQYELTEIGFNQIFFWAQFQKNNFAAYLGLVLVLALATFAMSESRPKKMTAVGLMIAVPIGWMFTFSRGGFVAIVVCLTVFLALERNKKLLQRTLLVTFLIGSIGAVVLLVTPGATRNLAIEGLRSIVTGESMTGRSIDTVGLRLELMNAGVEVIASRPVLGVGYNQWQFYSPIMTRVYDPQAGEFRLTGYSIHNRLMFIAANSGLIALVGYLAFLAAVLFNALRSRRIVRMWTRTYLNVFIASLLGMQAAMLFAPRVVWEWPVIGILIGVTNLAKVEKRSNLSYSQAPESAAIESNIK